MMSGDIITLTLTLLSLGLVKCQMCTKREVVTVMVRETYLRTYTITYKGCWSMCTKTKIVKTLDLRVVPKKTVKTRNVCCSGYTDVGENFWSVNCKPICMPTCKNGECVSPGQCACNEGYVVDPTTNHVCQPICTNGCENGNCIAPNKCQCYSGYIEFNNTCQPFCLEPCRNAVCVAPDICECLPGYRKTEDNICKPYCFSGCPNGICKAPDECQCKSGYSQNNGTCQPICTQSCNNGLCVAPEVCECFPGYGKSENQVCEPLCSSGCPNGLCIQPDVCDCNFGWIKNEENDTCIPECKKSCGNGTCVAPGTCECFTGYEAEANDNDTFSSTVCVPSCNNCINGTCTIPNECTCEPPLIAKRLLINGCENSTAACVKTICTEDLSTTIPSTTVDLTTDETQSYGENHFNDSETSWTVRSTDLSERDIISKEVSTNTLEENTQTTYSIETTSKLVTKENIDYNDPNMINVANDSNTSLRMTFKNSPYIWIYVSVPVLMLIAVLLIVSIFKRNSIAKWMKGGSYVVQDDKFKDATASRQSEDMSYQNILRKKKNEHSY